MASSDKRQVRDRDDNSVLDRFDIGRVMGLFPTPVSLSALIDELPAGVIILDRDRRILAVNQLLEALTGFNRDEIRLIPCRYILRTNFCTHNCPVLEADAEGAPVTVSGDIINRARSRIPIRTTATPLKDINGDTVGYMETVEDIRRFNQMDSLPADEIAFGGLLGRSPKMDELFKIIPVFGQTDSSVLITGETGTGKDMVAEAIHEASERNRGPFIKVNCGALPETLLESEMFGHKKGAFTGAVADKPGRIRLAKGGTLFLTEIGDLPLSLQVKLLTFLDDKIVYPLGTAKGYHVDVRVVAATHRNLEQMVKEGRFREDLLFRLNVVRVQLPPLRERGKDVELLMDYFLKLYSGRFKKKITGVSDEARRVLTGYPYPGNVRELRNIVEYAANICQGETISQDHLPVYLLHAPEDDSETKDQAADYVASARDKIPKAEEVNWTAIEKDMIVDALVKARGKRGRAAEILGWGRSTLWRKMKNYGLD